MQIILLERDKWKAECLSRAFAHEPVEVVCEDFIAFMKTHTVDCIVSPANSYGLMDGGYDLAISSWFGDQLQMRVQQYILEHYHGEQPVGSSFLIDAGKDGQTLIHTPTMRVPSTILDPTVIYQAMRSTLLTALEHNVGSIVIPLFGGATGGVDPDRAAKLMWLGYDQIMRPQTAISWRTVRNFHEKWVHLGVAPHML